MAAAFLSQGLTCALECPDTAQISEPGGMGINPQPPGLLMSASVTCLNESFCCSHHMLIAYDVSSVRIGCEAAVGFKQAYVATTSLSQGSGGVGDDNMWVPLSK